MSTTPSLPFLPGFTVSDIPQGRKKQTLIYKNGYALPKINATSGPVTTSSTSPQKSPTASTKLESTSPQEAWSPELTYGDKLKKPAKVDLKEQATRYEHKNLSFDAYFVEPVHPGTGSSYEQERVRKCTINFFIDDNSFLIKEKTLPNSGIQGGLLLKRQKVPKNEYEEYSGKDLNIGIDIVLFARTYRLISCDFFTQSYLQNMGIALNAPETYPEDAFANRRKLMDSPTKQESTKEKGLLKKFLENDRKVLRFYSYWDNRENLFGERKPFVIHYYLVDDTIEVRNNEKERTEQFAVFLKKQKLAKTDDSSSFVSDEDLKVGGSINIFGRVFVIYDCDEYTRQYYKDLYDLDFVALPIEDEKEEAKEATKKAAPPRQGVLSFVEQPPKKDFQKMLNNDRKILRFSAKLVSKRPEDRDRIFVVSYYLADDTVGIYEPPQRNSGITGGKFLERRKVPKPNSNENYNASDFFVGAEIEVFKHKFSLHDADEYAFNFMEANTDQFPFSDIESVQQKLKEMVVSKSSLEKFQAEFDKFDKDGSGAISLDEFRELISSLGFNLTEQELITVVRRYDLDGDGTISYPEFVLALK